MTFCELLKTVEFENIKKALVKAYPDQIGLLDGYKKVYLELLSTKPIKREEGTWELVIEKIEDKYFSEDNIDVSGKNLDNPEIGSYALELTEWDEWLSMKISQKSLLNFTPEEIISHCLYEMTFFGFEQKGIKEQLEQLQESVKQIEEDIATGNDKNYKTWEEFKKELDIEFNNDLIEQSKNENGTVSFEKYKKLKEEK